MFGIIRSFNVKTLDNMSEDFPTEGRRLPPLLIHWGATDVLRPEGMEIINTEFFCQFKDLKI